MLAVDRNRAALDSLEREDRGQNIADLKAQIEAIVSAQCVRTHTNSHHAKCVRMLCQNCVTYPPKPWGNTVTYGDTLKQIVVAGSR